MCKDGSVGPVNALFLMLPPAPSAALRHYGRRLVPVFQDLSQCLRSYDPQRVQNENDQNQINAATWKRKTVNVLI